MHSIEVRNFGPIGVADNIQINHLTVLIGEQASGKSTLAKLVYFFKSLKQDFVQLAREETIEIDGRRLSNAVRDKFFLYFGSTIKLEKDYFIRYHFGNKGHITLEGSPLNVSFEKTLWEEILQTILKIAPRIRFYRERNDLLSADREEHELNRKIGIQIDDETTPLYIPAGRNITVSYSDEFLNLFREEIRLRTVPLLGSNGEPKRKDAQEIDLFLMRDFIIHAVSVKEKFKELGIEGMLREMIDDESFRKALLNNIDKLLKGRYRYSERQGEYISLPNRKQVVSLRKASTGQQEAIRIVQDVILAIVDQLPVFRVIEEPEANLFPTGQRFLLEMLTSLLNKNLANGLFITTHSPYILTIINNLVFAGDLAESHHNEKLLAPVLHPAFRLHPRSISAYMMKADGVCLPINDTAQTVPGEWNDAELTGMIGENILEDAFAAFQQMFDELLEIGA